MPAFLRSAFVKLACASVCALSLGSALAATPAARPAVQKENFNAAFPAWESGWFAANSNAINVCAVWYCLVGDTLADPDPAVRGNAGSGIWLGSEDRISSFPLTITFEPAFAAQLVAFKMDVAIYVRSTLRAWDVNGRLIYSHELGEQDWQDVPPTSYQHVVIRSNNGISKFTFSGTASDNTVVDNLVAVTKPAAP